LISILAITLLILVSESNEPFAANKNPHQVTIDAVEICLGRAKSAIEKGAKSVPLISCNIPFSFSETEFDTIISNFGGKHQNQKPDSSQKSSAAKTVINIRSLSCMARVRVKNQNLKKALDLNEGDLSLTPQWVNCDLRTKAQGTKKVKFSFKPRGKFANECIKEFTPGMGEFNLDCTVCRLNFVAKTLSYWVNKIGSRMTPGINKALGKRCKA